MTALTSSESRFRIALLVGGLGIGGYVAAAIVTPPGVDLRRHVLLFLVAFACYLLAVIAVLTRAASASLPGAQSSELRTFLRGRWVLTAILAWAVILRAALLTTTPSLSDDVFRYVWDGKVAAAGVDPYRYPPSAPELASLRDPLWNGINAKSMVTPYPPLAEALFALVYRLAPDSLTAMQLMAVAFDLGGILLLLLMLDRMRMDRYRVLIYAWNPLVLVQFTHSAHFDSAMILAVLGALYLLALGRRAASGVLLGISTLVKLVPAVAVPLFLPLWGVAGLLAAGMTVGVATIPLLGSPALAGVLTEASDARFNDSASYLLTRLFSSLSSFRVSGPLSPDSLARILCVLLLVVVSLSLAVSLFRRKASWVDVMRGTYVLIGLFLVLNAVVEPWYLTWIVPFLCFSLPAISRQPSAVSHQLSELRTQNSRVVSAGASPSSSQPQPVSPSHPIAPSPHLHVSPSWGWLLLTGTVMLTDLTYLPGGGGSMWIWIRAVEYLPLYILFVLWAWRHLRHEPSRPSRFPQP